MFYVREININHRGCEIFIHQNFFVLSFISIFFARNFLCFFTIHTRICIKFIVNPIKSDALAYNLNRTDYQNIEIVTTVTRIQNETKQKEMESKFEFKTK